MPDGSLINQIFKSHSEYHDEYGVYPDTVYLTGEWISILLNDAQIFKTMQEQKDLTTCMGMRIIRLNDFEDGKAGFVYNEEITKSKKEKLVEEMVAFGDSL